MTVLKKENYTLPGARLEKEEEPLPIFRYAVHNEGHELDDRADMEELEGLGRYCSWRALPFQLQNCFNRKLKEVNLETLVLENSRLKAVFCPGFGGKLARLLHKPTGRELVYRNPILQIVPISTLDAWWGGGVEFNLGHFGHHHRTMRPLFAARTRAFDGSDGLRLYEWDRLHGFLYHIDFALPEDSDFLFMHVRVLNPTDHDLPLYWWTNMGVPEAPGNRVIVPAPSAYQSHSGQNFRVIDTGDFDGVDNTYPTNLYRTNEFFFRIPQEQRRWISVLNPQGQGMIHTSTDELVSRKYFAWGMIPGGRRWQRQCLGPGETWFEVQAGLFAVQQQTRMLPPGEEKTWAEAFGPMDANPEIIHGDDYPAATQTVESILEQKFPRSEMDALRQKMGEASKKPPEEILAEGTGWGTLELKRREKSGEPGFPEAFHFTESSLGEKEKPWLELLETGSFPETPPTEVPGTFMIQPEWESLLRQSVEKGESDHWLAHYHLGVMRMEDLDPEAARADWQRSLEKKESGWTLRNLGFEAERREAFQEAADFYKRAWSLGPHSHTLAEEYLQVLEKAGCNKEVLELLDNLPKEVAAHERVDMFRARFLLNQGKWKGLDYIFEREYATIREGEVSLTDLWFRYHALRIAESENIAIDEALDKRVRKEFPPPENIDFRLVSE